MSSLSEHTAPGQALGYYFQLERALSWIALAPADSMIGIETEDDVVVKLANGDAIYEQDKSSVNSHPFVPSKKDLWNTLAIWLEAIAREEIDIETSTFYLVTNKPGRNSLAEIIGLAQSEEQLETAYLRLKEASAKVPAGIKHLVEKVFSFDKKSLKFLFAKIKYRSDSGLYGPSLRKSLASDLQLDMDQPEQNEAVINLLTGWVFKQVVEAWRAKVPAFVDRNAFHRQKIAILAHYRQQKVDEVIYAIGEISMEDEEKQKGNRYVHQLELIGLTHDEIYEAIHAYLNAVTKRTFLAKKGYITQPQLDKFEDELKKHWLRTFKTTNLIYKNGNLTPEDLGQLVYFDTISYDTSIGDYVLKNHFLTRGSYQMMADILAVGWHPEYKVLFKLRSTTPLGLTKEKKDA